MDSTVKGEKERVPDAECGQIPTRGEDARPLIVKESGRFLKNGGFTTRPKRVRKKREPGREKLVD